MKNRKRIGQYDSNTYSTESLDKFPSLKKVVTEAVAESKINNLHLKSINDFNDEIMTDEEWKDFINRSYDKSGK
ncbi:hypothetical protein N9562_00430 [Flavobacteriaceae bacterium]|nr:hypothetical protein [Flavobacteriaceae bacterium]